MKMNLIFNMNVENQQNIQKTKLINIDTNLSLVMNFKRKTLSHS